MLRFAIVIALLACPPLHAHGGGVDSQGGHNNRKAGNYHFHRGPLSSKTYPSKSAATQALTEQSKLQTSEPAQQREPDDQLKRPEPLTDFSGLLPYVVGRVIDGDTVELNTQGGPLKVRLIGVDTPETVHPTRPVEYFGKEASAFTKAFIEGDTVFVEYDQERTDRYGRTLAYLYRASDGKLLNDEIIRQGYGHAYTRYPFRYMELFREAEAVARLEGKGLWGGSGTVEKIVEHEHDDALVTVYVTKSGKKYHADGCRFLAKSKISMDLGAAKAKYGACRVCRPPE